MRVFFCAGEASGDAYAEALAGRCQKFATIEGVGGPRLASKTKRVVVDSSAWGVVSITQSVKVAFRVLASVPRMRSALATGEPGVLVPIDYGFLNIRLARLAKRLGWKVLYFIPPGSWRRDRQGADLPKIADEIVTPFSWSAERLRQMGASVHWFGHPLRDLVPAPNPGAKAGVAVLPGSRKHEIAEHLPVLAAALQAFEPVEFGVAANLDAEQLRKEWVKLSGRVDDRFTPGDAVGVLHRARTALVCSGTATLQAALAHTPMVVFYRVSRGMALEATLLGIRRKVKRISLPNILLDRDAIPELIQEQANPEALRAHLDTLHADSNDRENQLGAFGDLDALLGPPGCLDRTAELIHQLGATSSA